MYSAKGRQARGRGRQNTVKAERAEQQLMDVKVVSTQATLVFLRNANLTLIWWWCSRPSLS